MARLRLVLAGLALALGLTVAPIAAAERPGGGGGFSGGGGGFSGGGSSGGGSSYRGGSYGGSGGDPAATLVMFGLFFVVFVGSTLKDLWATRKNDGWSTTLDRERYDALKVVADAEWKAKRAPRRPRGTPSDPVDPSRSLAARAAPSGKAFSLEALRTHDPNVSQILLEDFLYELYARAHAARGRDADLSVLAPYLDADARRTLASRGRREVLAVEGVIVGAMQLLRLELGDGWAAIDVEYESNYTERYAGDDGKLGFYAKERWRLVRRLTAQSRKPDETRSFGCTSCGAPVEHDATDACRHCGAKHGTGERDWLCSGIVLLREETRGPTLGGYAPEVGTYGLTVRDAAVKERLAALEQLDPAFDRERFFARVSMIYHRLNDAWSSLRWEDARPFLSDRLWLSMRYWIHAYEEQGLRNEMKRAAVGRKTIAKVVMDPFFHAITVRVWASAIDVTVHRKTGAVVGGDPDTPREYSEYWTFIRSAQRRGAASAEDTQCPSCGAALAINMAGNCEHCGVKLTAGQFDWVLSKIEQDEAYRG